MIRMNVWRLGVVAVTAGMLTSAVATADNEVDQLRKENAELRKRLEQVENALSEIKSQLPAKPAEAVTTPAELTADDVAQLKKLATMKDKPVHSGLDLKLYGCVKLDMAFDDSSVNPGNFARWVESESVLRNDSQASITANQTRLGLDIGGPDVGRVTTGGKVEIDFYGGGASENKSNPMLRHAYAVFAWPEKQVSVLAGQTKDIISPLFMPTVNYSVGWWQGNIGYRRPQLRLTKEFELAENTEFKFEAGPSRTISDSAFVNGSIDSGADAAVPTMQGRTSLSFPLFEGRQTTFGFSGHWGSEHHHVADTGGQITGHHHVDTWSVNLDVRLPVTEWLLLQGEMFYGENLYAYLGGIGQKGEIEALGGWAAATITPRPNWQFNLGAGIDDPDDADLTAADARSKNWMAFGNVNYFLTPNLTLAAELMYLNTQYLGQKRGDAFRQQFAIMYKF